MACPDPSDLRLDPHAEAIKGLTVKVDKLHLETGEKAVVRFHREGTTRISDSVVITEAAPLNRVFAIAVTGRDAVLTQVFERKREPLPPPFSLVDLRVSCRAFRPDPRRRSRLDRIGAASDLVDVRNDAGQITLRQTTVRADAIGDEGEAVSVLELAVSNHVALEAGSDAGQCLSIHRCRWARWV